MFWELVITNYGQTLSKEKGNRLHEVLSDASYPLCYNSSKYAFLDVYYNIFKYLF